MLELQDVVKRWLTISSMPDTEKVLEEPLLGK